MSRYAINSGEFRHPITIQKLDKSRNEYGEVIEGWIDFLEIRAAIYPLSGKDFFSAETLNSEVTHKINARYVEGITSAMRVKFGDRYFEIISPPINFQEKNILLQIMCKERAYES
ncbi:MAG: phage head closure protein [Clostridium sp.]|uniref:phage head closure protein n=1 Tax=Clostridium sp. TaxID=1506 RepID=UPI0025B9873F|nr:phage head closure protein [Clostridium sp.]MBS4958504.1 phage head closure protein [Clostridium sp.]